MTVRDYALARLRSELPGILLAVAVIVSTVNILSWLTAGFGPAFILDNVAVGLFLLAAFVTSRRRFPEPALPWALVVMACLLVAFLLLQVARYGTEVNVYYLVIVCAVYPSMTLFWRPYVVSAIVIALATTIVAVEVAPVAEDWVIPTLAALAAGGVVLRFRLRGISATVRATTMLQQTASTDPLTGALNRHGMEQAGREAVESALETGRPVFAVFFDVNGLKRVNDQHGHDAGDMAICVTADAARHALRDQDLLARWGGDEFVAIGIGSCPDVDDLSARVEAYLSRHAQREAWPNGVSIGVASQARRFEDLVAAADRHMYERRERRAQ